MQEENQKNGKTRCCVAGLQKTFFNMILKQYLELIFPGNICFPQSNECFKNSEF